MNNQHFFQFRLFVHSFNSALVTAFVRLRQVKNCFLKVLKYLEQKIIQVFHQILELRVTKLPKMWMSNMNKQKMFLISSQLTINLIFSSFSPSFLLDFNPVQVHDRFLPGLPDLGGQFDGSFYRFHFVGCRNPGLARYCIRYLLMYLLMYLLIYLIGGRLISTFWNKLIIWYLHSDSKNTTQGIV